MIPNALVDAARNRAIVPLIGSGLSQSSGMASWLEITNTINTYLGLSLESSLGFSALDAPDHLRLESAGSDSLREILEQAMVRGYAPNEAHRLLSEIPFRTLLTTNWDELLEKSIGEKYRVNVIFDEETSCLWRESEARQIVKFHGTVGRPKSIVFGLSDYSRFYQSPSLLMSLVRTIISTRPILAIGFGMNDPFIKALFMQTKRTSSQRHYVAVREGEVDSRTTKLLGEYGFDVVPLQLTNGDEYGLIGLLRQLRDASFVEASEKLDRTWLLVRETERLENYIGIERIIRARASLGPFAAPEHISDYIFGSVDQHKMEIRLLRAVEKFFEEKNGKFRLICQPVDSTAQAASKGYSIDAYRARLQSQYDNIVKYRDRIELAVSKRAMDINDWIAADVAKIESRKQSIEDDRLYSYAQLDLVLDRVSSAIRHFDLEFDNLVADVGGPEISTDRYLERVSSMLNDLG